jgi:hypothetical protein
MAADLTQSFMGKHFEKVVLAAAGVVFLGALGYFVIRPHSEEALRKDVKRRVDDVKKRIDKATLEDALSKEERVTLGIDQPALTVPGFESMVKDLGVPWEPLGKLEEGMPPERAPTVTVKVKKRLPKVVAIEDIETAVGRGSTSEVVPKPLAKLEGKTTTIYDVAWVGVVGKFDLTAQRDDYLAGNVQYQPVFVSKVELRRRELKPDGTWSDWAAVAPAAPKALLAKWPRFPANPQDKRGVTEWGEGLGKFQADVRRMPFYPLLAVDPEGQTAQSLAGPITGVEQPPLPPPKVGAPAAAPTGPPPGPPPPGPPPPPPGTEGPELPPWLQPSTKPSKTTEPTKPVTPAAARHVLATLWANDATVEPGKTYQYQMRPSILNPLYSLDPLVLQDPKDRWVPELAGEWSEPTKEVTIPPVAQFFFVGSFAGKPNLELHRWIFGQWVIVPSAQASVGAPVVYIKARAKIRVPGSGETRDVDVDLSPGILLVDVIRNFPYRPEGNPKAIGTNVLVYAEPQGRLSERIEWDDRNAARIARSGREKQVPTKPVEIAPPPPKPVPPKPAPPKPAPKPPVPRK